jgi:hypothetical protein
MGRLCIGIWITGVSEGLVEVHFLQIQIHCEGLRNICSLCVASHGLTSVFEHVLVSMRWADHHWDVRPCLLDALKSSWRSGIMVFLLTAWKTSSASNPGCLSRRYGKLTLSKVLHFHFQNLSSCVQSCLRDPCTTYSLYDRLDSGDIYRVWAASWEWNGVCRSETGIYTLSARRYIWILISSELRAYELRAYESF